MLPLIFIPLYLVLGKCAFDEDVKHGRQVRSTAADRRALQKMENDALIAKILKAAGRSAEGE